MPSLSLYNNTNATKFYMVNLVYLRLIGKLL